MAFLSPRIERYITDRQHSKDIRSTEHVVDDPQLDVSIWSDRAMGIDHDAVLRYVVRVVTFVRQLPWSQYNPKERWSAKIHLTPFKRRWCASERVLTPDHVNGGVTSFHTGRRIAIEVFRYENFAKVFIHECLHAHRLDRLVEGGGVRERFPKEAEAFIEAMARYLYCRFVDVTRKDEIFAEELGWTRRLANNLRRARWTSDTNTFSYYLVCCALLHHWSDVMAWFKQRPESTMESDMRQQWAKLRDRCWSKFYANQGEFWLPEETLKTGRDFCFSLSMVKNEISFTADNTQSGGTTTSRRKPPLQTAVTPRPVARVPSATVKKKKSVTFSAVRTRQKKK